MKLFSNLLGMALAGTLGYLAEPSLRFQLTGIQPSAVEMARNTKVVLQMPDGAPPINLASLTAEQLPQQILLNTTVKLADAATGVTMSIPAGNRVKLVRIEGGNAVVSPGEGPYRGLVPITETDLLEQIAANPPTRGTPAISTSVEPPPTTPPVAVAPEPVTPPAGDSAEPLATMPEPPPTPEPTPEPAPAPAPAGEAAPTGATGTTDAVKAMQDSIKAAQIKEFTFEQVLEWKAEADETVDGETYQTGVASYTAETIFGVKTIQAKALIKAGKVQRWIWPKSGMEIK